MNWLEQFMKDLDIKSRYELSQKTGISQMTFSHILSRDTKINNIKVGIFKKIADGYNLTLDELYEKINGYDNE